MMDRLLLCGGAGARSAAGWLAALLLLALAPAVARGQEADPAPPVEAPAAIEPVESDNKSAAPDVGGAAPGINTAGGHGWALQPREILFGPGAARGSTAGGGVGASLVHLPPRIGPAAREFGTVRTVMTFPAAPARVVGYGPEATIIFDVEGGAPISAEAGRSVPGRRVLGITAAPVGIGANGGSGGGWRFVPPGRAAVKPDLPGTGALVGASASSLGPVVLLREGDHAAGESTWRVLLLWRNAWRSFDAPWMTEGRAAAAGPGLKGLIAGGHRAVAVGWLETPRTLLLYEGRLSRRAAEAQSAAGAPAAAPAARSRRAAETLHIDWTLRRITLPMPEDASGTLEARDLAWIDGTLVLLAALVPGEGGAAASGERGGALIYDVTRDIGVPIAHLPGSEQRGGRTRWVERFIPMHGAERFALVSLPEEPAESSARPRGRRAGGAADSGGDILEMSTTGRLWYEGEQVRQGPLSLRDLRALAFMLGSLAVLVIIFVFRPEAAPIVTLPQGAALGALWRRTGAAMVDFMIAAVLASLIMGHGALGLLSALLAGPAAAGGALGGSEEVFTGLMLAQVMGIVHCSLTETLSGRSIGKGVFGLIILSSRATPGRLDLRAALLRNIIKWGLPLLLVFAVWDPMRRHPGDLLAGTLVVERAEEGEE